MLYLALSALALNVNPSVLPQRSLQTVRAAAPFMQEAAAPVDTRFSGIVVPTGAKSLA